ncbi:MAG: hypothetical protein IJI46_05935 [Erysipelotrichaceae bacterium]|nr:hypothetical protein [Erysipelotrichaceae bacterium]
MISKEKIDELTLILLYLNSFKDDDFDNRRSWKGYAFSSLNELEEKGFISQGSHRSKSVYLTKEGIEKAKELLSQLGFEED